MNKETPLILINDRHQKLKQIAFETEKAEFNDDPIDDLMQSYTSTLSELINSLSSLLEEYLPLQLPPLEIKNKKLETTSPLPRELIMVLEEIDIESSDDKQKIHLNGNFSTHHRLLLLLGSYYLWKHQADQATGFYQEVSSGSYSDVANYNLSYCLAVQKILPPALECLDNISESFSQDLVQINRAVIYDKLGRFDEARMAFLSGYSDNSDYQNLAHYNYGLSAMGFGKHSIAEKQFKLVLQQAPKYPGLHFQFGQLAAQQGLYQDAVSSFEIAHLDDPYNMEILEDLGTACLMANRIHEAIDYYNKYLLTGPSLTILNNLGASYLKINEYQKAIDTFDRALEINPDNKQSIKNRALAYSFLN